MEAVKRIGFAIQCFVDQFVLGDHLLFTHEFLGHIDICFAFIREVFSRRSNEAFLGAFLFKFGQPGHGFAFCLVLVNKFVFNRVIRKLVDQLAEALLPVEQTAWYLGTPYFLQNC